MRWIVGDIHGMLTPLQALVAHVQSLDRAAEFLFVGDYVNRGPDSKGVIDLLLTLDNARFVRGNHDDVFDQIVNGRSLTGKAEDADRLAAFSWFMQYGLDQTFISYGIDPERLRVALAKPSVRQLNQLAQAIPQEHKEFLRFLPPTIEDKDIFVAHAMWDPDDTTEPSILQRLQASEGLRQKILWGRFTAAQIAMPKVWMRPGFFGHTPVFNYADDEEAECVPVEGPKIVLLDTAVALMSEGRLTAYCVEEEAYVQVTRSVDVLESDL